MQEPSQADQRRLARFVGDLRSNIGIEQGIDKAEEFMAQYDEAMEQRLERCATLLLEGRQEARRLLGSAIAYEQEALAASRRVSSLEAQLLDEVRRQIANLRAGEP